MTKDQRVSESVPRRGLFQGRLVQLRSLGSEYRSLVLELDGSAGRCFARARAGQFVQLACRDIKETRCPTPLLRRPFSIAGIHTDIEPALPTNRTLEPSANRIYLEIILRELGPGTNWLTSRRVAAPEQPDTNIDIMGPLGNGFTLPADPQDRVILLGGGVGLPPIFFLADQLARAGFRNVIAIAGLRTASHLLDSINTGHYRSDRPLKPQMVLQQFVRCGTPCIIATDDASCGFAGSVVEAMEQFLNENNDWDQATLCACGPAAMLKATAAAAKRRNIHCQVCMEAYMACGIGVCQSCAVEIRKTENDDPSDRTYKLVCANGPVFDADSIAW